ncbi:YciI family protein [Cryobacterium tepidiphilum]|nr:YciI family protein [Cryobacterium tepidiphilum]
MPTFVLLYTDVPHDEPDFGPDDVLSEDMTDDIDHVEEEANDDAAADTRLREWVAWSERVGDALVDFGHRLGGGRAVHASGSKAANSGITGYSIIQADDIEAATDLVQGHPHLASGFIQIFEAFPAPEM